MKCFLSILIICLPVTCTYGQLNIKQHRRLTPDDQSISFFLKNNKIDSGLIAWGTTSSWPVTDIYYDCLLKQEGTWYLTRLSSPIENVPQGNDSWIKVKSKKLSAQQADSLLKAYNPDATFKYTQADFNKLPVNPTYKKGDLVYDITINDGGESHLAWYRYGKFSHINYFEPGTIFRFAYPHLPKYQILSGFVKCTEGLLLLADKIRP